jgi:hypothetical protein
MTPRPIVGAVITVAVVVGGALTASVRPEATAVAPRPVVVAELFTSEGCSSCPPADALLRRLVSTQPIEGVDVIGLSEHVDYWNRLGWRDPYSAFAFSQRQSAYNDGAFHNEAIYTPQMVIDGHFESVGSDEASVRRNILAAAREGKAQLDLAATASGTALLVDVTATANDGRRIGDADLVLAVTESGLTSAVARGENRGRTLAHDAVVRSLTTIGRLKPPARQVSAHADFPVDQHWRAERLRVVVLLQERTSHRIVGAAAIIPGPRH